MTASSRGEVKSRTRVRIADDLRRVRSGDLLLPGTRGMTGGMNNRKNNVLPFPEPPEEPGFTTIIAQIGRERFAIHMQFEHLPPAPPPVVLWKRGAKKAPSRIVK